MPLSPIIQSKGSQFPWVKISFFLVACGFVILAIGFVGVKFLRVKEEGRKKEKVQREARALDSVAKSKKKKAFFKELKDKQKKGKSKMKTPSKVVPSQPKSPPVHLVRSGGDIRKMSKGFILKTKLTIAKSKSPASIERKSKESYVAHYELKITRPQPSTTLEALEKVNPGLSKVLPSLKELLPQAKVSPFFERIYENKLKRVKAKMASLGSLMTMHNFYDCETILELKHPQTGRRALLLQSEMDVVSDGSDGDRLPEMPAKITNSSHYQPMTSYGWKKTGKITNPLIPGWRERIRKAKEEIAKKGTSKARKSWLRARIKKIKREIQDMTCRSYLIAEYDPFIVMPINMISARGNQYAAKIGDYAVIIYKGKIYPTIIGDAGPSFKTGEASLRIAKELNSRSGIYSRPVSDLAVTYLVFPGTADKFQAPDYEFWRKRCLELVDEFGGLGENVSMYFWKKTLPPIEQPIALEDLPLSSGDDKKSPDAPDTVNASPSNQKNAGKVENSSEKTPVPLKEKSKAKPLSEDQKTTGKKESVSLPPGVKKEKP